MSLPFSSTPWVVLRAHARQDQHRRFLFAGARAVPVNAVYLSTETVPAWTG